MTDQDTRPPTRQVRRHPSAGNLGPRPVVVGPGGRAPSLPPSSFPLGVDLPTDMVRFGPDLDHVNLQRLLGPLDGRRVLELGSGSGTTAVALARRGARVIAVEPSAAQVQRGRSLAEEHGVRVEFHQGDIADLPFVRADSVDLCLSVYALARVVDPDRVFRQVHRVLRSDASLICSVPHPITHLTRTDHQGRVVLEDRYPAAETIDWTVAGVDASVILHSTADLHTQLVRSNFRVENLLEPMGVSTTTGPHRHPARALLPETLILRARKQGS